ncbi:MAG: thiol:disulfide interchange protein DsbA/DsbL [Rhodocyclaceae bacterium]|jgi:thiol:disulfide interchange protein DsbA|nr:thiol:disulfide interchange protein DsbA/DsbL [Rhodocyclaceae bacterium]
MQRRQFIATLIAGLGAATSNSALAQAALGGALSPAPASGAAIAGQTYAVLNTPAPAAGGKMEVLEFFSYGCPHCHEFAEPFERWSKKQKDIVVRRVPVTFGRPQWVVLGRLFYTIQLMKLPSLDAAAFAAIHQQGRMLYDDQAVLQWAASQPGVDANKFKEVYFSQEVTNAMKKADAMAVSYQIDAVPSIIVGGRYKMLQQRGMNFTDLLANTDAVIKLARQAQK